MTLYTPTQIFDLLDEVSCEQDINELEDYLKQHSYDESDMFNQSLTILRQIFTERKQ